MPEHPVIAIIMATLLEAEPFITALALEKQADEPCPVYRGENLSLVISGIGKANAALATTFACLTFRPGLICNLGAAGATGDSSALGKFYQIDKVVEPDRPNLRSNVPHVHYPLTLPSFETTALATQDRPVIKPAERRKTALHADLCDMEGSAVIQTAAKFNIPCLLFKFVSDTPHPDEQDNIVERIKKLRDSFCRFFLDSVLPKLR
jgi:adenosylhomocysteine nucleosidase